MRKQGAGIVTATAGLGEGDSGIHAERQCLLFAFEAIGQPPIFARSFDVQVQPTTIAVFVASCFAAVLGVFGERIGQCHVAPLVLVVGI